MSLYLAGPRSLLSITPGFYHYDIEFQAYIPKLFRKRVHVPSEPRLSSASRVSCR